MTDTFLSTQELLDAIEPAPEALAPDPGRELTHRALLAAAAPLHLFSPSQLNSQVPVREPVAFLLDDIVPAVGWSAEGLWTLKSDIRRSTIAKVGSRAALADLRALNVRVPATDVQRMLDRWLSGEALILARLPASELAALRTIAEWGLADIEGFPDAMAVEAAWRRRSLVANFEQLAKGFVGRERELRTLRKFAAKPNSAPARGRCLILHGSGGAGKSALVSRFILDLFDRDENAYTPFTYLALDDQTLDPSQPVTLMSAAVRQLEQQPGFASEPADPFAWFRKAQGAGDRNRRDARARGSAAGSQRERLKALGASDMEVNRSFAAGLEALSRERNPEVPLLFVIDTFEEASYRPETDLVLLYDMLQALLVEVPAIRLLLLGRAMPPGADFASLGAEELALGDLDHNDALRLLANQGFDPAIAEEAIQIFGRNPLTLRLVAHAQAQAAIGDERPSLAAAGEEVIRGQLYRRILNHIHDPVVRRLAHPGMVLRRITPQVIAEVLAPVCRVHLQGSWEASWLFDTLAREHTLVSRGADGALVYREEIRRPMLKLIGADAPEEVAELHRAAADFYEIQDGEASREEELYHLLMTPEQMAWRVSRERFPTRIAGRLASAIDEFPPESQILLAQLTRVRLDPSTFGRADTVDTDNIVARDVLYLMRTDRFEEAFARLTRDIEPGSSLGPLKVRVLRELGRPDEAETFARRQIEHYPPLGSRARLAQLMWFASQCGDDVERTRKWLERLLPIARKLPKLALVQTLTELKRVARSDQQREVEDELATTLSQLSPSEAHREERLARLALVRMGPREPLTWGALAPDLLYGANRSIRDLPPEEINALGAPIADILRDSPEEPLQEMAKALGEGSRGRWIERLVSLLDDVLRRKHPALASVRAAFLLFSAEKTSLAGASLAGLEEEQGEDWGPDAPTEAVA